MKHVFISGDVQGVGFRQYVKYKAKKLSIKGWVKNLDNGKVEALFDGSEKSLDEMLKICNRGPFLARVKNVEIIEEEGKLNSDIFEIIKT
jgi:acylphosphatase